MDKEKMTAKEIEEFNNEVEFNQSAASWVMDIICCLIFWPMIISAIYRRMKYRDKIELDGDNNSPKNELMF